VLLDIAGANLRLEEKGDPLETFLCFLLHPV